jgi:hypothetical protein
MFYNKYFSLTITSYRSEYIQVEYLIVVTGYVCNNCMVAQTDV